MNLEVKSSNYRNDAILLGFSDLKRLKTERPPRKMPPIWPKEN